LKFAVRRLPVWFVPAVKDKASRWRFLFLPKWLGWHAFVILSVLVMLWLGNWQLHRAEAGNSLSWAYTFEWPLFAIFAVYFWIKTLRDEVHPPAQTAETDADDLSHRIPTPPPAAARVTGGGEPAADDAELAPYNAYRARLTKEVRGHGRWHGLR
jgi:hypothetical protein